MLYIMRHGKTEWNKKQKLQGRTNVPLSDEGRSMAKAAKEETDKINIDICFTSPLERARETAEIVLEDRDIPVITDDRLMEMSFGEYEGMENYFSNQDSPISALFHDPGSYKESAGGAETFEELFQRTGEFLSEQVYPRLKEGKDILIVGHGAMNSAITCQIKDMPIEQFWSSGLEQCRIMQLI